MSIASIKRVIQPNPGPQERFLASKADIAIYGGAAGGGKTFGMLLAPLQRRNIAGFGAVIFRRIGAQIRMEGGLWDSSAELYPYVGGTGMVGRLIWKWPNGFRVGFRHLEDDKAIRALQGAQIPLIGFDELTHFTKGQFTYMLSRNRSTTGFPGRMRATCNADSTSWVKEFIRWWLDDEGRYPREDRAGVLRWLVRDRDAEIWYDTEEEAIAEHGPNRATSVTFIPAKLNDNQRLLEKDPSYKTKLAALAHVERQQLEFGDWKVKHAAGEMFKREWFQFVEMPRPLGICIRYWDRASTPAKPGQGQHEGPAWTVGVRMRKLGKGQYVIEDVVRMRGRPKQVEDCIVSTAKKDGHGVSIGIEQDPGQAGVAEASYYTRQLEGFDVRVFPVTKAKVIRATPMSAQAEARNIALVPGSWNEPFLQVLEGFPDEEMKDDVDSASGAFNYLVGKDAEITSGILNASTSDVREERSLTW